MQGSKPRKKYKKTEWGKLQQKIRNTKFLPRTKKVRTCLRCDQDFLSIDDFRTCPFCRIRNNAITAGGTAWGSLEN